MEKATSKMKPLYFGQQLTAVLPGGPKLGTKERKKWLWTKQAYVQIPKTITIKSPVKQVVEILQNNFKYDYFARKVIVRKSECESNYERIEICIPPGSFDIHINTRLQIILRRTQFYIAHIYRSKEKSAFKILLCREASYSRRAK